MPSLMGAIRYRLHFSSLASLVPALVLADPWRPSAAVLNAGLYAALHAASLAFSVRNASCVARKLAFVVVAAVIAMCSVLLVMQWSRQPELSLASIAGIGASGYFLLVRRAWIAMLPLRAMAWIAGGCVVATTIAFSLPPARAFGGLGIVAAWWFAFSVGLFFVESQ